MRTPSLINGTMQTLTVRPGLEVNWADFQPTEPIRQHVDSCHTRLRFYFYHTGCGHWQLRSPFEKAANNAKNGCPVSKVLNADITMDTTFEG